MSVLVVHEDFITLTCDFDYDKYVLDNKNYVKCMYRLRDDVADKYMDKLVKVVIKYLDNDHSRFGRIDVNTYSNVIELKFFLDILERGYSIGELARKILHIIQGAIILLKILDEIYKVQ